MLTTTSRDPLVHTYSIVAVDESAGEMGVAVQSHYFSVGSVVPWAEAGVGVIATQSVVNVDFGPEGLKLLREGSSPAEAVSALLSRDEQRDYRQLAIAAPGYDAAVHTGAKCIPDAGHTLHPRFSVQANLMRSRDVWPAMAEVFTATEAPLAERLMRALEAAEQAGGDIRGRQSAAILIVGTEASGHVMEDRRLDLRVEDHPEPLPELRRLIDVRRAYDHASRGDDALARGDFSAATAEFEAADALQPENLELRYWRALTLAGNGNDTEAERLLKAIYLEDESWRELTRRLATTDLAPLSEEEMNRLAKL
jgi:uncharacterized Ntn-hydrolase superfamily protein